MKSILQFTWRVVQWLFSEQKKEPPFKGRFMTHLEQQKLLRRSNEGFVIDGKRKLPLDKCFRHCVVIGNSGSGKSTICFVPTVLNLTTSAVVLDCSGEVFELTSGYLASQGFTIKRVNLSDTLHSEQYNPMSRIEMTDTSSMKRLATTLVETAFSKSDGRDQFWNMSAANLIYVLIRIIKESTPEQYHNLANVRCLLNNLSSNSESATRKWVLENAHEYAYTEFKGAVSTEAKILDNILTTCRTALEKLADEDLARLTNQDTLGDLYELMRKNKTVLYLTVMESEITYYSFLLSLLLTDLFSMAMKMPKEEDYSLLFLLDEFTHMKIPNFSTLITTLRKRRVGCLMCTQSKSMFTHQYSKVDAETILTGGCASFLYLPGQNNFGENEELSQSLGKKVILHDGKPLVKPVLTADEIFTLKNKGIFIHSGNRPALLKLTPFYKNPRLEHLTLLPPVSYAEHQLPDLEYLDLKVATAFSET
jgi:type IV secretory pathway TraG/TraD family ATPase VirD4